MAHSKNKGHKGKHPSRINGVLKFALMNDVNKMKRLGATGKVISKIEIGNSDWYKRD